MKISDITTFGGTFLHPEDGRRYVYEASFNAYPPIAWRADLTDADGWSCKLAGALIEEHLSGPQLRSAITAAIAMDIRATLLWRAGRAAMLAPPALHN